jgi:hypothetical protein
VRSAKFDEVGLAYKVVFATVTGNGALATPGIHMCPVRDGDPANCGGDKGTDVLFFCRNRLAEFEIRHLNDFRFLGKCSWTLRHPQDQLRVQSKALSGRLATIALELSPDASSIGHRSAGIGFQCLLAPGKDLCFTKPRCDSVRLYVPALLTNEEGERNRGSRFAFR